MKKTNYPKFFATLFLIALGLTANAQAALLGLNCIGEQGNKYNFDFEWGSFIQKNAQGKVLWATEDGMLKTHFDKNTGILSSLIPMRTKRKVGAEVKLGNDGKFHGHYISGPVITDPIICDGIYAR